VLSAPGWYTGYAPKILPGVREAIEEKRWRDGEDEVIRIGKALDDESAALEKLTAGIRRLAPQ
jgi:N-acetylated-alpha-linked acidic dipeptidase